MAAKKYQVLTDEDVAQFMQHGYVHLKSCFTPEAAAHFSRDVWTRLDMSPTDKSTWTRARTNMPWHTRVSVAEFSPKAWGGICDLVGGAERVTEDTTSWGDSFIVNLGTAEGEGEVVRPWDLTGWHCDGDFFVHFLDSPEQGLLVIPLFTDIVPDGGATWICTEGVPKIAKYLYDHPEGVTPHMHPVNDAAASTPVRATEEERLSHFNELARTSPRSSFIELTGKTGDVILLHPLTLHTASHNTLRKVRIITNPPVSLREPFRFERADGDYSLVERKTMAHLGGEEGMRGWRIKGERRGVVPERVRVQEEMRMREAARLEAQQNDGGEVDVREVSAVA